MPLNDFWNGDYDLIFAYQKAYINKLHKYCHLQGAYNNIAFSIALGNSFRKKGSEPIEYPIEDIFNPFNNENNINNKKKTFAMSIDTTKNNNELYQLKRIIEERKNVENG